MQTGFGSKFFLGLFTAVVIELFIIGDFFNITELPAFVYLKNFDFIANFNSYSSGIIAGLITFSAMCFIDNENKKRQNQQMFLNREIQTYINTHNSLMELQKNLDYIKKENSCICDLIKTYNLSLCSSSLKGHSNKIYEEISAKFKDLKSFYNEEWKKNIKEFELNIRTLKIYEQKNSKFILEVHKIFDGFKNQFNEYLAQAINECKADGGAINSHILEVFPEKYYFSFSRKILF